MEILPPVKILGDQYQGGTYILLIKVLRPLKIQFGKFKNGKLISLLTGQYIYVGSALSKKGSTSLGRRILRHLSRSNGRPPQVIRNQVLKIFHSNGIGTSNLAVPQNKSLFWNIDYLLEQDHVFLSNIIVIRHPKPLEKRLSKLLDQDPYTSFIVKGLGANDYSDSTHLLRLIAPVGWWSKLAEKISILL